MTLEVHRIMLKRLILVLALGGALVACSPAGTVTSPGSETIAPAESMPAESMPAESMPAEAPSASPS
jgi:predicted small lipoprotein YifL